MAIVKAGWVRVFKPLQKQMYCWLTNHDWKRAVRFLGNTGSQTCRRCGAKRDVVLRPRRDLAPKGGV
jgi:hypothetical protein